MVRKLEEAAYLVVYDCLVPGCEDPHIVFHDITGESFAVATLSPDQTRYLIRHLQDALYKKAVEKDGCPKPN